MEEFIHFWLTIYALFYVALGFGVVLGLILCFGDWIMPKSRPGTKLLNSLERWGG